MKKHLITFIKIAFSAALIFYLFRYRVDLKEVVNVFRNVRPGWLLLGASLHFSGLFISAVRWKILLNAQGIRQPVSKLLSYYLVGHFFNMFLPTKIGGDFMRIYDTSRDHGKAVEPFTVVLVERISGLLTMLLICALVLAFRMDIGVDLYSRIPGLGIGIAVFLVIFALFPLLFHPVMETFIFRVILKLPVIKKLAPLFQKIYKSFQIYAYRKKHLLGALFMGFILQINYFLHYYLIARSIGIDVPLSFFFVIIPIRSVALMIPFFINGIGLREFFDVTAFNLLGISEHTAIAFAELAWFVQIAIAIFGGMVYAFRKRKRPTAEPSRETSGKK